MSELLDEIISANRRFVQSGKRKESFHLDGKPKRKVAIFTCMDSRLTEFVLPALGLKRGDAKVIKTAGNSMRNNMVDTVMFSLVACVYELGVEKILVIGHYDCGMTKIKAEELINKMNNERISSSCIGMIQDELKDWLSHFKTSEDNVKWVCHQIKTSPILPERIQVHGLMMDPQTGEVTVLEC
jgi:carbonic anhydrase